MDRRRVFAPVIENQGGVSEFLHTYYVSTTGNDTSGNGSLVAPYATPVKALSVAVAGDGILLQDGSYSFDGVVSSAFTDYVTMRPVSNTIGTVTLSGTSGLVFSNVAYLRLSKIAFSYATANIGITVDGTSNNIQFLDCTATHVTAAKKTIWIGSGSDILIQGGEVSNAGGAVIIQIGVDGDSGIPTQANITIKDITTKHNTRWSGGHLILVGYGASNCVIDGVTVPQDAGVSGDVVIGLKHNADCEIKNCDLTTGTSGVALLFKGTVRANAHDNILRTASGYDFRMRNSDDGTKCQDWQLQNSTLYASGTGKALAIDGDDDDLGGGICDYNAYQSNSGLGAVRGDADVQSLAELQAAWADYDVTTNDAHSAVM